MRRSTGARVLDIDGIPVAINFGADFVAEHEFGIDDIYYFLGIDSTKIGKDPVGIGSRVVQQVPNSLLIQDYGLKPKKAPKTSSDRVGYVGTLLGLNIDGSPDPAKLRDFTDYTEYKQVVSETGRVDRTNDLDFEPLTTGWSDRDFAVFARKPTDVQFLKDLYVAMKHHDAALWFGVTGNPFENPGLTIGIVSRMPADVIQKFIDTDMAAIGLEQLDLSTGIKDRLKAASTAFDPNERRYLIDRPFSYFALSPRKISNTDMVAATTAYQVVYWLNPCNQTKFNYGWYTVEELDAWMAGEGPIPKANDIKKSA